MGFVQGMEIPDQLDPSNGKSLVEEKHKETGHPGPNEESEAAASQQQKRQVF